MTKKAQNKPTGVIYLLTWSNSDLQIVGPKNDKLEKLLSFTKKELVMDFRTYQRTTKRSNVKVFNVNLNYGPGIVCYQTFQGLLDRVKALLEKQGHSVIVNDSRIPFKEPKFSRMQGFRFNQEELTKQLLSANRSGLLTAPTRFGKSVIITNIINAFPDTKTLVLAPGVDLLPQLVDTIKKYCVGERDVKGIFSGSKDKFESDDITVCSFDSMHKLDKGSFKLIIIDEAHAAVSDSRLPQLLEFTNARIYGLGATLEGRWSGNDICIEGVIGPVLAGVSYLEAVEMGALCPIHAKIIKVKYTPKGYKNRNTAYNNYLFKNKEFHELLGKLSNEIIPKDWQTLVFINNEEEAKAIQPYVAGSVLAMDKLMKNKKERQELFKSLKDDEIKRCICSNIYSTGVTIDNIRCIINADTGGGSILSVQKPGRLAEIKPNKTAGYMFDFLFEPTEPCDGVDYMIARDSKARLATYKDKGYKIDIYESIDDIKFE